MPSRVRLSYDAVRNALHGTSTQGKKEGPGVFERLVGFASATGSIKNVHIMNDFAQSVCGGLPEQAGDLLCRVVREGVDDERSDNTEAGLRRDPRFGTAFTRAYPETLGSEFIRALRHGAAALLNADKGMYLPGTGMASPSATNVALLGADGFRRFRIGPFLAAVLPETALARVRALYNSDADPVSRALRPLFQEGPLASRPAAETPRELTKFDEGLGRGMATLLEQPLSKPVLLRYLSLASAAGVILKIYGVGSAGGVPTLLALPVEGEGSRPLRAKAVLSLRRATTNFDKALAGELARNAAVWRTAKGAEAAIEVSDGDRDAAALELVEALQSDGSGDDEGKVYWPTDFASKLGRTTGFVLPKDGRAGWGNYLSLTPEALELLVLMFVPAGERLEWRSFWSRVRDELGIIVGANQSEDAKALDDAGVPLVSLQDLEENAEVFLEQSVQRGVAHRLPDAGAEVGGTN